MKKLILAFGLTIILCTIVVSISMLCQYKITFVASTFSLGGIAYLFSCEVLNK